jgi:hypothetical protein
MRGRPPLVRIDTPASLLEVAGGMLPRRIELSPKLMPEQEGRQWQATLNRELSVCGCGPASATLLIAFIAFGIIATQLRYGDWWLRAIVVVIGASAAMSITKLLIVKRAHTRFRAKSRDLAALLRAAEMSP